MSFRSHNDIHTIGPFFRPHENASSDSGHDPAEKSPVLSTSHLRQTHVPQVVNSGMSPRPEFAFSVVEDLVELLKSLGYCRR
jgi:hypothetical protein